MLTVKEKQLQTLKIIREFKKNNSELKDKKLIPYNDDIGHPTLELIDDNNNIYIIKNILFDMWTYNLPMALHKNYPLTNKYKNTIVPSHNIDVTNILNNAGNLMLPIIDNDNYYMYKIEPNYRRVKMTDIITSQKVRITIKNIIQNLFELYKDQRCFFNFATSSFLTDGNTIYFNNLREWYFGSDIYEKPYIIIEEDVNNIILDDYSNTAVKYYNLDDRSIHEIVDYLNQSSNLKHSNILITKDDFVNYSIKNDFNDVFKIFND